MRRVVLGLLVVLVLAWLAACALQLAFGARDLSRGADAAGVARTELSGSNLLKGGPPPGLQDARRWFGAAEGHMGWPLLTPLQVLPVLGRQISSARHLTSAAYKVTVVGDKALRQAQAVTQGPHPPGPERLAALSRLSAIARGAEAELAGVDLGPGDALVSELAHHRQQFSSDLDRARSALDRAAAATQGAADILSGSHRYLLLIGNNAEMRSGSAMYLEIGTMVTSAGDAHLQEVTSSGNLTLPPGAVPVGGDLAARWGWLDPSRDFRSLGLTPQFDVSGPLAAEMWAYLTGEQVDGVVGVDVQALSDLLRATGPVVADGTTVTSASVPQLLMHDQYAGLSNAPAGVLQAGRRTLEGDLAAAAVAALDSPTVDLGTLAQALTDATEGRHLLVWSRSPQVDADWRTAGAAGTVSPDSIMASVLNTGGNKLDQYLRASAALAVHPGRDTTSATLTLDLQNTAPGGTPSYILGPFPGLDVAPGDYVGIVAFNLPAGSSHALVEGYQSLAAAGPEGPTLLLAAPFEVGHGASLEIKVDFELPGAHGSVQVVPSARIPAVSWSAPGAAFDDGATHRASW